MTTSVYFLLTGPGVAGTALLAALVNFDTTRVSARFSDFSFSFSDFNFCSCCKRLNYLGHIFFSSRKSRKRAFVYVKMIFSSKLNDTEMKALRYNLNYGIGLGNP